MDTIHLPVPRWLGNSLRRVKYRLVEPPPVLEETLEGDRDLEWSFVAANIPSGPGKALDFGCDGTNLSLIAARRGYETTAIDLEECTRPWSYPNRRFIRTDLMDAALARASFDVIINCSVIEHVGLPGRYGVEAPSTEGDLAAMQRLRELLKPSGIQILTIPVGRDSVFPPWHRVYGPERLPRLLDGYDRTISEFWQKREGRWVQCNETEALSFNAAWDERRRVYALGCFVLHSGPPPR